MESVNGKENGNVTFSSPFEIVDISLRGQSYGAKRPYFYNKAPQTGTRAKGDEFTSFRVVLEMPEK
jgi:hypothetical protein